jgi:hypothetical protein
VNVQPLILNFSHSFKNSQKRIFSKVGLKRNKIKRNNQKFLIMIASFFIALIQFFIVVTATTKSLTFQIPKNNFFLNKQTVTRGTPVIQASSSNNKVKLLFLLILMISKSFLFIALSCYPISFLKPFRFNQIVAKERDVSSSSSSDSLYTMVAYQYMSNKECAEVSEFASGVTYNQCYTAFDETGTNAIGSGKYTYLGEAQMYSHGSYAEYKSSDCSGEISYTEEMHYPKHCLTDDASSTSAKFTMNNSTDISSMLKNGVVFS